MVVLFVQPAEKMMQPEQSKKLHARSHAAFELSFRSVLNSVEDP